MPTWFLAPIAGLKLPTQVGFSPQDYAEMEFLDMNLTKESISFAPCYLLFLLLADFTENQYSTLVLKLHTKKSVKQENSTVFMNSIFSNRKTRIENQTKTRDSSLCLDTSTKTAVQEYHLWMRVN
jgi:hypothetical protein